jgi:hypothetical protein
MPSEYDTWKVNPPVERPYLVACRVCGDHFEPVDCAEVEYDRIEDDLTRGICKWCAKEKVDG